MTDEAHALAIQSAAEALNARMAEARRQGLRVDVETVVPSTYTMRDDPREVLTWVSVRVSTYRRL